MSLDHGFLNVPLAKRGHINAQIDRFKAEQKKAAAAQRKSRAQDLKDKRAQAKLRVSMLSERQIEQLMEKLCLSRVNLLHRLNSVAYWEPDVILKGI